MNKKEPKKLRYSDILGPYFYNIGFNSEECDYIDTFFTGASHHLRRFEEATTEEDRYFHLSRHRAHLRKMMKLIHERGDFSKAVDPSNRDLDRRESWDNRWTVLPDPKMFTKMSPDVRYPVGKEHCADLYLHKDEIEELPNKHKIVS